jgi:hypothetical protein
MKCTVHKRQLIISRSVLLRMKNVSDKRCGVTRETHFGFNNFYPKIVPFMWKNFVVRGRPQMTIWRMCIAFWIPKATNAYSGYVVLIAFLLQQWLYEGA